ncbi:hypothetical protein EIP86_000066 [Pleurotus ostreatoroseus]|nr:hypothetical protein EIP86_000066 [Pleurotus ostreatoroseus]
MSSPEGHKDPSYLWFNVPDSETLTLLQGGPDPTFASGPDFDYQRDLNHESLKDYSGNSSISNEYAGLPTLEHAQNGFYPLQTYVRDAHLPAGHVNGAGTSAPIAASPYPYGQYEDLYSMLPFGPQPQVSSISSSNHQLPENSFVGDMLLRGVQSFTPPAITTPPLNVEEQFEGLSGNSSIQSDATVQTKESQATEDGQDVGSAPTMPPLSSSSRTNSFSSASSSATFVAPAVDRPRDGEEIPQQSPGSVTRLRRNRESHLIATFSYNGQEGVRMDMALNGPVLKLDKPDDDILPAMFSPKPQYRFFFPGYEPYSQAKYVKRKNGFLKRAEIVRQIAEVTNDFIKKMERTSIDDGNEKWKIGRDGIRLENLELIGLKRILAAGLQPIFRYRQTAA